MGFAGESPGAQLSCGGRQSKGEQWCASIMMRDIAIQTLTYLILYYGSDLALRASMTPAKTASSSPLEALYRDIEACLKARLYYPAVSIAVALPDICSSLEERRGQPWQRYKEWFHEYAAGKFEFFNKDDCYDLRCGVVHNARLGKKHDKHSLYDQIVFTIRDEGIVIDEGISLGSGGVKCAVLQLDVFDFCNKMIDAARAWEVASKDNLTVNSNIASVVRFRPAGFPPHIEGVAVIA